MSQSLSQTGRMNYSFAQYLVFMFVGFLIWLTGVVIVRVVGTSVFSIESALLPVFFFLSIPIGFINMIATAPIFRVQMRDMMTPALVMVATTLVLDGFAITFTDIYSADSDMTKLVAGWLLWSFGVQLVASIWLIGRANRD